MKLRFISVNQTSLNADVIMPLTLVLLLRAGIHHLGAELALLDDLTDGNNFQFEMNGIRGYCLTTLKVFLPLYFRIFYSSNKIINYPRHRTNI